MMLDSPSTLQEYCVDFICDNISAVCEATIRVDGDTGSSDEQQTADKDFTFLHSNLTERLLETLGEKKKLTDSTLLLFDNAVANLKRLRLLNAGELSLESLQLLKKRNFVDLELSNLSVSVADVINGCLSEWTLNNLRSLNVTSSVLNANVARKCLINVPFHRLRCLRVLNVSRTEFNQHCFEIITNELPLLESIDISSTKVSDISPLRRCKDRLRSLNMYNLQNGSREEMVKILVELSNLRHLDVSDDRLDVPFTLLYPMRYKIASLLSSSSSSSTCILPHLISLDISGKEDIDCDSLAEFINAHPHLIYLGLVHTSACEHLMFTEPRHPSFTSQLTVSGSGSETQIVEALKRYIDRPLFMQKSLYYLFQLTQTYNKPRVDVVQLILPVMECYPKQISIQMAATACLYNLSKGELGQKIHPKWLRKIVELTMAAMENFPTHMQLQKNTLLTLCNDRILQEVSFDKYRCAKLVMDCLCAFEDPSMNRMCVAICSILAAKISTTETSLLGAQHDYMKKLLKIVKSKVNEGVVDITLKFTLSALWNLTDESPGTCAVFLEAKGLNLFLDVLQRFPNDCAIETKVLGLLNNIAEVKLLRSALMKDAFVDDLMRLLSSSHLDVSYFAAGIVAHLASDGEDAWLVKSIDRATLLSRLGEVVLNWKTPEGEMVAYRSFSPFFPLLNCFGSYEVQLWAVWAMQHVCNRNYKRYCPMLIVEGGEKILKNLVLNPFTSQHVKTISTSILDILEEKGPFFVSKDDVLVDASNYQLMER